VKRKKQLSFAKNLALIAIVAIVALKVDWDDHFGVWPGN